MQKIQSIFNILFVEKQCHISFLFWISIGDVDGSTSAQEIPSNFKRTKLIISYNRILKHKYITPYRKKLMS